MTNKVCLVIFFNHRYEKNIPKLYKYYAYRFDSIKIIMPFYKDPSDSRVLRVYGNSWHFQDYFRQAYQELVEEKAAYYIFVGDDCLLNPVINQENIINLLRLHSDSNFISDIQPLAPLSLSWKNFTEEKIGFSTPGVEYFKELPGKELALRQIKKHKIFSEMQDEQFLVYQSLSKFCERAKNDFESLIYHLFKQKVRLPLKLFPKVTRELKFPLLKGYSDFLIVNKDSLEEFVHLCGIYSSMHMFAEIAIPTALALSCNNLVTLEDTQFQAKAYWSDFRKTDLEELKKQLNGDVSKLFEGERNNYLWIHPIKFSIWEIN